MRKCHTRELSGLFIVFHCHFCTERACVPMFSQVWYYAAFSWHPSAGLRYFQNGQLTASTQAPQNITRERDIFTTMTVGKPNNINIGNLELYYGKMLISDLLIWSTRLTDDEVLHSYKISRELSLVVWVSPFKKER